MVEIEGTQGTWRASGSAGATAGIAGGAILAAWITASALITGVSAAEQLRAFAGVEGSIGVLVGLLVLSAIAVGGGVAAAAFVSPDYSGASAAVIGGGLGLAVMVLVASFVAPAINQKAIGIFQELGGSWVVGYVLWEP